MCLLIFDFGILAKTMVIVVSSWNTELSYLTYGDILL